MESGFFALVVRMLVSLGTVLAIIGVAFLIARRRVNGIGVGRRSTPRAPGARSSNGRTGRRSTQPAIEVVGRAGLSKGATAVALRFGDSVILVGVSEAAPTSVLTEMDAARWDELQADQEYLVPVPTPTPDANTNPIIGARPPSFVEALREATTRRA